MGSNDAVGSSRMRSNGAGLRNARATAMRCHSPPDSSCPSCDVTPSRVLRPSGSLRTRSFALAKSIASLIRSRSSRSGRYPTPTFSDTLSSRAAASWNTLLTRSSHKSARNDKRSMPSTRMLPVVGLNSRVRSPRRELFPAPLSPTMATTEPAGRCRSTPSRASRSLDRYRNPTFCSSIPRSSLCGGTSFAVSTCPAA